MSMFWQFELYDQPISRCFKVLVWWNMVSHHYLGLFTCPPPSIRSGRISHPATWLILDTLQTHNIVRSLAYSVTTFKYTDFQIHELVQDGAPQWNVCWFITSSKYSYLRIIHYCYSSYKPLVGKNKPYVINYSYHTLLLINIHYYSYLHQLSQLWGPILYLLHYLREGFPWPARMELVFHTTSGGVAVPPPHI